MAARARGDQDDESKRYTEGGINVVALDRHGRGSLHRARPERLAETADRPSVLPPRSLPRVVGPPLVAVFVLLAAAAITIAALAS